MEENRSQPPRIHVRQAVIVEGRYDKIKLSSILDATIIETHGFRIFKDRERMQLLRVLAEKKGLIVLTDSDAAGFKIRHHIAGSIDPKLVKHVYIPDVYGKERRKEKASREGKLGVEGISRQEILKAFEKSGVLCEESGGETAGREITKIDLFEDGLTGTLNSAARRGALLKSCELPEYLGTNAMLVVLNVMMSYDAYKAKIAELFDEERTAP
ncbi:toprim domain-containing protein [Candidatus Soleaferrea massiliensis]|uniref:toprim domain-containing protein n=1 Tax=Candidatus Soleaferrea massiliensis TaxID=1470354 RepID=UPI00058FE7FA|nr:DUF4093 domain-containing protein [Candidatus Soleaferrea massiliensis]